MKRALGLLLVLLLGFGLAAAKDKKDKKKDKAILSAVVVKAQYVYVTTYDGPDSSPNVTPADRQAVIAVQDAVRKWGKYRLAYHERDADLIFLVHSSRILAVPGSSGGIHVGTERPPINPGPGARVALGGSDDELAVYQGSSGLNSSPLWRGMASNGLQGPSPALVQKLRAEVEEADKVLQEQEKQKKQKP